MTELSLDIIHLIAISAIINGVIYSILLLFKKENKQANRFLSLLIFSLYSTLIAPVLFHLNFFEKYTWLKVFPFWTILWTGPAFYFYCISLTNPKFTFNKKNLWHFSLILLNYLPLFFSEFFTEKGTSLIILLFINNIGTLSILAILIYVYVYMAYRVINKYQNNIFNNLSSIENIQLNWIKQIINTLVFSFAIILLLVIYLSTKENQDATIYIKIIPALTISFTIYWLSIRGYIQAQTIPLYDTVIEGKSIESNDFSEVIKKITDEVTKNKLHQNPDLSLNLLSKHTAISEREISNAINQHLNKNFYTFINEFRVKEVIDKIKDHKNTHIKILNLAYDAGFNSKPTFNRVFKEYTGNSPSFYRPKSKSQ